MRTLLGRSLAAAALCAMLGVGLAAPARAKDAPAQTPKPPTPPDLVPNAPGTAKPPATLSKAMQRELPSPWL